MTIKEIEDMIRIFEITPKKIAFTLSPEAYQCLVLDLSMSSGKSFTGKTELKFNLGETQIIATKE